MSLKKRLKKLFIPLKDPTTFFSGFEDSGIVVMVYVPSDDKEKQEWLVRFHREDDQSLICEKRYKRSPSLPKLVSDRKVLGPLQEKINKVIEELNEIQKKKENI